MSRSRWSATLFTCALAGAASACVDKAPPAPAVDPALVADNLLTAPPTGLTRAMDVSIGGKVTYLGYTTDQPRIVPGEKVSITHYWRVDQAPGKNWRVFSHLEGGNDFVNVDQTDMRKGHPVDRWAAGQIIRDPQTFILRKDWRAPKASLRVGIYKKGGRTVNDRMAITGPDAKDNALAVISFDVDVSQVPPPPPPPGQVTVAKATGPIVIDGKADEPAWAGATSAAMVTAEGGPDVKGGTTAQLLWDDRFLYAFVSATDHDVWSDYTKADDTIWKQDVVELFIDADGNGRGYVELQVSPKNVQFDTWFAQGRGGPTDLSFAAGMQTAVNVRGTLDNRDDEDEGWDAELAIPLEAVKGKDATMAVRVPPQPGDTWRLNVVRVDYPRGEAPAAAAWNRIRYTDFHSLDRMLSVQFAGAPGATTPPTPVAPGAPGGATAPTTPVAPGGATVPTPPVAPGGAAAPTEAPGVAPVVPGSAAGSATATKPPGGATAAGVGPGAAPTSPARRTPRAPAQTP